MNFAKQKKYLFFHHFFVLSLLILLMLMACKHKCKGFSFSPEIINHIPKLGQTYKLNSNDSLKIEVIEVVIDSTKYSIKSPFTYVPCESIIIITYRIGNYTFSVRLSKEENNNTIFTSISGLNLVFKDRKIKSEKQFIDSEFNLIKLDNNSRDTTMIINMKGFNIEKVILIDGSQ